MKQINYKLYNFYLSSASQRVRIALNYKKIPYEYVSVNIREGEQRSLEYAVLNPNQRVPCLNFRDHYISESPAILQYLEDVHPEPPLLPKNDPVRKAHITAFGEIINSSIQPFQNVIGLRPKLKEYNANEDEWVKYWVTRGYTALETYLAQTKGKYCFGDQITMADVYFYPQALGSPRFKVDLNNFPNMKSVLENLQQVEAFQKSNPEIFPQTQEFKRQMNN